MPLSHADANRVWRAPTGLMANMSGVSGLQFILTDLQNPVLNTQGLNRLRHFKVSGELVWGARTSQGSAQGGSQWQYVAVKRFTMFLESSLDNGAQWVVFEPNNEPLWGQIRLNVGSFLETLSQQGAFQGATPQQAYFLNCNLVDVPQPSSDHGVIHILAGFAPLVPPEPTRPVPRRRGRARLMGFEVRGR